MDIIIAGAGGIGFHLAQLLASANQNIRLIDVDEEVLQYAADHLDVFTVRGDASSIDVLRNAGVANCQLFISTTTHESTNLLTAILAKKLGARRTIARVNNPEYIEERQLENFREVGIDELFSPLLLAAEEIGQLIHQVSATDVFNFEDGKISIVGFTVDNSSGLNGKTFDEFKAELPGNIMKPIAILRATKTLRPFGATRIRAQDHIYIATNLENIDRLNAYVGKTLQKVKRLMIVGGGRLALQTARLLEKEFSISVVAGSEKNCKRFIEQLDNSLVIQGKPDNIELLREEGLENMDAFVALTPNSETNIITSLTAERFGVYKTIAHVDNVAYTHISQQIGVDTLINQKLIAANNIFRYFRKGKVEAIKSLQGVEGEIIEFNIAKNNTVTAKPIGELRLPEKAVVAGVVRQDAGLIVEDDFRLQLGDKVIIFAPPSCIESVTNTFR